MQEPSRRYKPQPYVANPERDHYSHINNNKLYGKVGSPIYGEVGDNQQSVRLDWAENLNIVETQNRISGDQMQTPLCGINCGNNLVFCLKDGSLMIYSLEGKLLKSLK